MESYLYAFKLLKEKLQNLEKDKKKINNVCCKIKTDNVILLDKIKYYKEILDTYKRILSFPCKINSVSNLITMYLLSFTKDLKNIENEHSQNIKWFHILQKKLCKIHIDISKTKLKLIIQA
jgi:hypothetical protein